MIDFKQELSKYQPILELDRIEDSIHTSEIQDILDILQHISKDKSQVMPNQTGFSHTTQNR